MHTKRDLLKLLPFVRKSAQASAGSGDGFYERGLRFEGYVGGYLDALHDVEAFMHHGYPSDQRGYWAEAKRKLREAKNCKPKEATP